MATHLLFETAAGISIFESKFYDEVAQASKDVQEQINDVTKFGQMVSLKSFVPFKDAAQALQCANDISEGVVDDHLKSVIELNLPNKKSSTVLGVSDKTLGQAIKQELNVNCDTSTRTIELLRGIRLHAEKLLGNFEKGDIVKSQLGLGHAYSRAKVKFNVNRSDNMIIQAIALLDQLDKDVNTFAMRVREWYGWHFPELVKIVAENYKYALAVKLIGDKSTFTEDKLPQLAEILDNDEALARNVYDASRASMGTDISPVDLINISNFADRVINLFAYRKSLQDYLKEKMGVVAPNLRELLGDSVGARLISHAGSLTNLSKYPASTVQILGAEKALFRALKTKGNTPKYGLIYHSPFIGKAGLKNKGRISRYLANKSSIAARIDNFSETPTSLFGQALRKQVEDRLAFYETGSNPTKNSAAMAEVLALLEQEEGDGDESQDEDEEEKERKKEKKDKKDKKKKRKSDAADDGEKEKKKKRKAEEEENDNEDDSKMDEDKSEKKKKKDKKEKKKKRKSETS